MTESPNLLILNNFQILSIADSLLVERADSTKNLLPRSAP